MRRIGRLDFEFYWCQMADLLSLQINKCMQKEASMQAKKVMAEVVHKFGTTGRRVQGQMAVMYLSL